MTFKLESIQLVYFTNIFFCQLHLGFLILISVGILDLGTR